MSQEDELYTAQSSNDTLRMLAESAAPLEERSYESDMNTENTTDFDEDEEMRLYNMTERERANELLMAKELKNLQFDNPGTNQVLAEYHSSIGASRKKRAVRQKQEEKKEYKDPYHDEKGKLIVNGERYALCDCLQAACLGCHWPCKKCGSRRCGPICQVNRNFTYDYVSDPYAKTKQYNPIINPL